MTNQLPIPTIVIPDEKEDKIDGATTHQKKTGFGIGRWLSHTRTDRYKGIQAGTRLISRAELAAHTEPDNMWMALPCSGKLGVYDVTSFAKYHPGGVDLLVENSGVDASEAFRMAHSYVNVNMISKLRIGYIDADDLGSYGTTFLSPRMIPQRPLLSNKKQPTWQWHHNQSKDSSEAGSILLSLTLPPQQLTSQLLPDLKDYRVVVAWRPSVSTSKRGELLMKALLDDAAYYCLQFRLLPNLMPRLSTLKIDADPAVITEDSTTLSRLLISLTLDISMDCSADSIDSQVKTPSTIGSVICDRLMSSAEASDINSNDSFIVCRVVESKRLDNTRYRLLQLAWPEGLAWVPIPLGHHVVVRLCDESDNSISRPYTPVTPMCQLDSSAVAELSTGAHLSLLIKVYPYGQVSSLLDQLSIGDSLDVSLPMGKVTAVVEQNGRPLGAIFMLAAGSGVTPMLRPLAAALFQEFCDKRCLPTVHMICFDRDRSDQVLVDELQQLSCQLPDRFSILHVLSNPREPLQPGDDLIQGRVDNTICSKGLLTLHLTGTDPKDIGDHALWLICGPAGFNEAAVGIAHSWKVPDRCLTVFSG